MSFISIAFYFNRNTHRSFTFRILFICTYSSVSLAFYRVASKVTVQRSIRVYCSAGGGLMRTILSEISRIFNSLVESINCCKKISFIIYEFRIFLQFLDFGGIGSYIFVARV